MCTIKHNSNIINYKSGEKYIKFINKRILNFNTIIIKYKGIITLQSFLIKFPVITVPITI